MKNYRIYILALLLVIASQSLLAIDGWWEKIETKNKPRGRYLAPMCNIAEDKVIMMGGQMYGSYTLEDKTKLWMFDYQTKDWQLLNVEIPDFFKRNEIPLLSLVKLGEGKAMLFFSKGVAKFKFDDSTGLTKLVSEDSTTWVFHFNEMRWEHIKINPKNSPSQLEDYPEMSLSNLDEGKVLLYRYKTFVFKYNDTTGQHWYDKSSKLNNYFERRFVGMVKLKANQVFIVSGMPNGFNIENNAIVNWLYDDNETTWTPFKINNSIYKHPTYRVNAARLYDGIAMGINGTSTDSTSYLFVPNLNQIFRKFDGQEARPNISEGSSTELKDGRIIDYGGAIVGSDTDNIDTWIFHADPALSVETLESNKKLLKKVSVDKKLLITQDLLDNRIIQDVKLFDLLGAEVTGIEQVGNEIKFNCTKGTYLLQVKLNNFDTFTFLIIKE